MWRRRDSASLAALLALAAAHTRLAPVSAQCSGSAYSYGSGACASCAAGATFVSASLGCTPSSSLTAGPADTALYLSGTQAEGVGAFPTVAAPAGVSFSASPFGAANGSLALASGSYLAAPGASAPAALPAGGNVAFSASAWVKCAAPASYAAVLEWGLLGDAGAGASPEALALDVGGLAPLPNSGVVSILAGSGNAGASDGAGASASFNNPTAIAVLSGGSIVIADRVNNLVRLVSTLGSVSTVAASASPGFNSPYGIAVDASTGDIVLADTGNSLIRKVSVAGAVTTLISSGLSSPYGVAVFPVTGAVIVADTFSNRVLIFSAADSLTRAVTGFAHPTGVAIIASTGVIVVVDSDNCAIRLIDSSSGAVSTLAGGSQGAADGIGAAARFNHPISATVVQSTGYIVVADTNNNLIRLVSPYGAVSTLVSTGLSSPYGVAMSPAGIFIADTFNHRIRLVTFPVVLPACDSTWHHVALTYSPSASPYTLSAFLDGALVLVSAATITLPARTASTLRVGWSGDLSINAGSLFAGALADLCVYNRSLSASELVALAQPPLSSVLNAVTSPPGPTLGATSYAFSCAAGFAGMSATLVRSAADGSWAWSGGGSGSGSGSGGGGGSGAAPSCSACAPGTYSFGGTPPCARCAAGATFVSASLGCAPSPALSAGPADAVLYLSGSQAEGVGAFPTIAAPAGVSFSVGPFGAANGSLVLASGSYLAAPGANAPAALPAGGNVAFSASAWVKCAAPASYAAVLEWGLPGDAGAGASPQALALDVGGPAPLPNSGVVMTLAGSGNDAFADGAGLAASFSQPTGVAVLPTGIVLVTDHNDASNRVRLVSPLGVVTTLAGSGIAGAADGAGLSARFFRPTGVAVLPSGAAVIADLSNHVIRMISSGGLVTTLAGNSISAGSADGVGTAASFENPWGLAYVPSSGFVAVADTVSTIRLVSPLGVATTLAGSGVPAFADGPGTAASFNGPKGVAAYSSGVIVVADSSNNRIRLISPTGATSTLAGSGNAALADGLGTSASFNDPWAVAIIPSSGVIVVADTSNHRIRLITPAGLVTTLAASSYAGGIGAAASFNSPCALAVDPTTGGIVVAEYSGNRIRLIALSLVLPACDSTWHHVALTYSPSASPYTLSAFLDGALVLASAATITLPARTASTLRVGWSGDFSLAPAPVSGAVPMASVVNTDNMLSSYETAACLASSVAPLACSTGCSACTSTAVPQLPCFWNVDQNHGGLAGAYSFSVTFAFPSVLTSFAAVGGLTDGAHEIASLEVFEAPGAAQISATSSLAANVVTAAITSASSYTSVFVQVHRAGPWQGILSSFVAYGSYTAPAACARGNSLFAGALSDLRIYARAISASEVTALAGPPPISPSATASASARPSPPATRSASTSSSASASASAWHSRSATPTASAKPLCKPGFYSGSGFAPCVPCSPGTFASAAGSQTCELCPAGTFGDHAGLASAACSGACAACTAGSTADSTAGTMAPPASLTCGAADARAIPGALGLQLWPAAHPANPQSVNLIVAPLALCQQLAGAAACGAAASVVGADGVTRFVVGTAAALNMEASEALTCSA